MGSYLGIDFGTTNSVVAALVEEPARLARRVVPSELGEERTPSAVAVDRQGFWRFGRAAREADTPDKLLSVKRRLGSGDRLALGSRRCPPEGVAALLFRHLANRAEAVLGEPARAAVVTVPANSKGLQRAATKAAATAAGLRVLNLINEPTAAAMAYGLGQGSEADLRLLVYDFGGGTFDVTVLRIHHGIFEELASRGLRRCGGDDIDTALAACLRQRELPDEALPPIADLRLRLACEEAKIALGERPTARVDLEELTPGCGLHAELTRDDLARLAEPWIARTATPVREALAAAQLLPTELDHVLLVGGTCRLPAVRDFVEALLGRNAEPFERVDPMTCVAEGAAIVAGIMQGAPHLGEYDYQVCLEHSLCIEPVDPLTGRRFLEPVIGWGTPLPNRNTKLYYPVADYSPEVAVRIVEGNDYEHPESEENVRLGEVKVPLEPRRPSEQCPIAVEFEYREDGLLTATARDLRAERTISEVIAWRGGLTVREQGEVRELLTEVFGSPPPEVPATADSPAAPDSPEMAAARRRLAQAEQVLAKQNDAETALLRDLRERLAAALASSADNLDELDRQLAAELLFFDYLLE